MPKLKIKKGDTVVVIAGRDKGRQGKVLTVYPQQDKIIVESINRVKKHVKPNPRAQKPGGIIEKEAKIHISNVALFNPVTQKADKVKMKIEADGKKLRYFKSTDERVDV